MGNSSLITITVHILTFVTSQKSGTVLATENAHVQTLISSCKAETQFSLNMQLRLKFDYEYILIVKLQV